MLGLRINPLRRKSRKSLEGSASQESIVESDMPSTDSIPSTPQRTISVTSAKSPEAVNVAINELQHSDSDHTDTRETVTESLTKTQSHTASVRVTRAVEVTRSIRKNLIIHLDDVSESYFEDVTLDSYLDFIGEERLLHMPRKGSQWDRVLKAAEFFGLEIWNLEKTLSSFVLDSKLASTTALAGCRLLLELGHNQSRALEPTFNTLFELGSLIAEISRSSKLFGATDSIRDCCGDLYSQLVALTGNIAIHYRQRINSMTTKSVSIDFDGAFGKPIEHIWATKEKLARLIWGFQLRHKHYALSFETVQRNLCPVESSLKTLLHTRLADKAERTEGTCEWFQSHLLDFFRSDDKLLTISGPAGSGKSMLAEWAKSRLQRPMGRKSYEVLAYTFTSDAPAELNLLAFLKSLVYQLLERNVGDTHFYEKVVKALEAHSEPRDHAKLENDLWLALEAGFETIHKEHANAVVVIDGIDELPNKHDVTKIYDHLHKHAHGIGERSGRVRFINISEHKPSLDHIEGRHVLIQHEKLHGDDIALFFRHKLPENHHYKSFSQDAQQKFIDSLVKKANGSFLWAKFAAMILVKQSLGDNLTKAGDSIHSGLHALLDHVVGKVDLHNSVTKHLFAFMLAARRPLTIDEMTDLLQVDLQHRHLTGKINLRKHIAEHCAVLVTVRNGLLRFCHSAVRKYVLGLCGKRLMSMQEAHYELTLRLLLFSKLSIHTHNEPSFDGLGTDVVVTTFSSHHLLEYVVRYWVFHFQKSIMHGSKGELNLPQHFKDIFPDSATFAMLEWWCWQSQGTVTDIIRHHELSLQIRIACFGEKHQSVMQSLIIIGNYYKSTRELTRAAEFYYRASIVGQAILYKFSITVVTCTSLFLTLTETITITERTTIVTYREQMIRFMIEICKRKHGAHSDVVIRWYETLAQLYIAIKEEHHAKLVYKELHEIIVIRFGKGSSRAKEISQTIIVRDGDRKGVEEYEDWFFETSDELEIHDELRISVIIRLALSYEASGKWLLAEKLFINLWCRISELCRTRSTTELHLSKIYIAIEYVKFLQRIKRTEEATNILICLWAEYEHHSSESELLIIRIKEIGMLFKSFGLLSIAISVFAKVWGWFKSKGKIEHPEAASTTVLITEVVEEYTETTTTTRTKKTTVTTTTETVVREIFETTYTRCKNGKVDSHFFKSCMALINLYILQENWSQAEIVIRRTLELTWKGVLTTETNLTITGSFISESILVATRLATCYHRQRQFEKAEAIYLRIYRACLVSLHAEHVCIIQISTALIQFYEEYHRHDKVIEIYVQLLELYRKQLGAAHKLTIKTLYALGSVCMLLGRVEAYNYYIEIVTTLNKGKHCHRDAFEASIILVEYYHREKRWTELQQICAVLWESFVHHHHEYVFTEEIIKVIYERYLYVLEFHAKVEYSVLYKLTVEYRETVTKVFGVSAAIVLTAMIALAQICEKHEKHYHESVTIYEEVIKRIKTTTTTTTIETETITKTVKRRLSKMYVTIITTGGSTSPATVERGITIAFELYEQYKIEYGCWHETTLLQLKELVLLYRKHTSSESHTRIVHLLQTSVIEIITTVTTSMLLFTAAKTLAHIYVSVGMVSAGRDLLHQLHHQIILRDLGSVETITIKLDGKVGMPAFVFLVAFDQCLEESVTLAYSEIMVDILTEKFLYEQYTKSLKEQTSIELVLEYGAKLRSFWEVRKRTSLVTFIDRKLFETFKTRYSSYIKSKDEITHIFYLTLLTELGKDRSKVDFGAIVCWSGNAKVKALLEAAEFHKAHELAKCIFHFAAADAHRFYHRRNCVHYGYKLAELLAGIDVRKTTDHKLRESMLETSRLIMRDVLMAFREAKIEFVSLKFEDLAGLVRLLGDQQNYGELENLLEQLWRSREVQKTWSSKTVLSIGRSLVHAYYGNGQPSKAIELCDTICYNLRRSRGWLDPDALAMTELLTQLYTSMHRHADVMRVHEEILREIDENDDDAYADAADKHFKHLRAAFHRLGRWDKNERTYKDLHSRLLRYKGLKTAPIDKWAHKGDEKYGQYHLPQEWHLEPGHTVYVTKSGDQKRNTLRAASGRWGHNLPLKTELYV